MPRVARIVIPGAPHHITQCGNNRQDVFFTHENRRAYLGFLREAALKFGLDVWGYCLMTKHAHLIETPRSEDALGHCRIHTRTGRPLGSDTFLSKLEARLGRRLRPLPRGRQKGWRK